MTSSLTPLDPLALFLFFLLVVNCTTLDSNSNWIGSRSIERKMEIVDRPFYARLIRRDVYGREFRCGGSIVSVTQVMTAASCVGQEGQELEVQVGSFMEGNVRYNSIRGNASIHPKYKGRGVYDIALVELEKEVEEMRVIPICKVKPEEMIACGMGLLWREDFKYPGFLHETPVREILCLRLGYNETVNFCGQGHPDYPAPCKEDQGGPLFGMVEEANCQYGVVSVIDEYCKVGVVFTRADFVHDFPNFS